METLSIGGLLIAFFGGVLAGFSPCMLPVLPGLFSILGITEYRDGESVRTRGWLRLALLFLLGLSGAFIVLGAGVGIAAELIVPYLSAVQRLLGIGLILFGLVAIASETGFLVRVPLLNVLVREWGVKQRIEKRSRSWAAPVRALVIGAGFGLAWTPCIGPFLGAIMTYAVSSGDMMGSTLLLTTFSVGLGLVFLVAAAGAASLFAKFGRLARVIAISSSVMLIMLGLMFLFGYSDTVSRLFEQWIPDVSGLFRNLVR